jgi:hypothetical protein
MTIGMRRIDLAAYLATPSIVVRRGANQIIVSDFHRWAEDVGEGINRHGRQSPRRRRGPWVDIAPWPVRAQHDYLVQLHVTRFEGMADSLASEGSAHVPRSWDIIRPVDGGVVARGSTDLPAEWLARARLRRARRDAGGGLDELAGDVLACLMHVRSAVATRAAENNGQQAITCGGRDGDV